MIADAKCINTVLRIDSTPSSLASYDILDLDFVSTVIEIVN